MARILVVDDSPLDRQIVGSLLERSRDNQIFYAENGTEGLKGVEQQKPDIVLTDLQMPGMSGIELVEAMKKTHPQIPVILMTAAGSEEIAVKALKAGASSYVTKNRLAQELRDTVTSVMDVVREQQRHAKALLRLNRWEADFSVECDIDLIMTISAYLMQSFASMELCDSGEQVRVGVALAEALLNAYYHGTLEMPKSVRDNSHEEYVNQAVARSKEPAYKNRKIQISARFSRGHAIFSIRDEGDGFDTSKAPNPLDPRSMTMDRNAGRGLMLMRTFMDDVKFNEQGNQVTMIKKAAAKPEPAGLPSIKSRRVMAH